MPLYRLRSGGGGDVPDWIERGAIYEGQPGAVPKHRIDPQGGLVWITHPENPNRQVLTALRYFEPVEPQPGHDPV